jgi:hypothetical protein
LEEVGGERNTNSTAFRKSCRWRTAGGGGIDGPGAAHRKRPVHRHLLLISAHAGGPSGMASPFGSAAGRTSPFCYRVVTRCFIEGILSRPRPAPSRRRPPGKRPRATALHGTHSVDEGVWPRMKSGSLGLSQHLGLRQHTLAICLPWRFLLTRRYTKPTHSESRVVGVPPEEAESTARAQHIGSDRASARPVDSGARGRSLGTALPFGSAVATTPLFCPRVATRCFM